MVSVVSIKKNDKRVMSFIKALDDYQNGLYPEDSNSLDPVSVLLKDNVCFLGAMLEGELCGMAAVKRMPDGYGEIKRVYVDPAARGKGVAKKLMLALEAHLREHGLGYARLETGIYQGEAIALYAGLGYSRTGPFGCYPNDPFSVFMEKRLIA